MRLLLFAIITLCLGACATSSTIPNNFKVPEYQEKTLSNGLKVLLFKDDRLPAFSMELMIMSGYANDSMAKSGMANMTASMLNKGAGKYSAQKLAEEIEFLGSKYGSSVGSESTNLKISGLSTNTDRMLELFSQILLQPRFQKKEFHRLRKRTIASIKKQLDSPSGFASKSFDEFVFGEHPYGRTAAGEIKDLNSMRVSDLKNYYQKYYSPKNSYLAVVGKFDPNIVSRLEESFGSWENKPVKNLNFSEAPKAKGIEIRLMAKEDLKQSQVRIGHVGPERKIKEYLELRVGLGILGSGLSGRLMEEIRSKRGLTYGIYSGVSFGKTSGKIVVRSSTRNEKVGELVGESIRQLELLVDQGVTSDEVKRSKAYFLGNFPRAIETPAKLAGNILTLRLWGIEDSYLNDYIKNINSISKSDVNRALRKYLDPKNLKIVVFGPSSVAEQLREIGVLKVENL
ncbi:MAG: M16 family metallopeptidase [Bdellovibrionales bacterium]